jgi:hypothetical protein
VPPEPLVEVVEVEADELLVEAEPPPAPPEPDAVPV